MKNQNSVRYVSFLIIAVALFLAGAYTGRQTLPDAPFQQDTLVESRATKVVNFLFDFGDERLVAIPDTEVQSDESLFHLMERVLSENDMQFEYTDYGGELGVFINSIDGVGSKGDRWWQYWVNNKYATVGVSSYMVNPGDIILFKYTGAHNE